MKRRSEKPGVRVTSLLLLLMTIVRPVQLALAGEPGAPAKSLQIVMSSLRERPAFAGLFVYHHDGGEQGRLVARIPVEADTSFTRPTLAIGGRLCLVNVKQTGGFWPQVRLWDPIERSQPPRQWSGPEGDVTLRTEAVLSPDGRYIACSALDAAGEMGGWDIQLFDRETCRKIPLPGLNSSANEREVTISTGAKWLACTSDRSDGRGLSDVLLYDREAGRLCEIPAVNSAGRELNPAMSPDGEWLAFITDRDGVTAGKDLWLYELSRGAIEVPAGLNAAGHEQTPGFSPDGRWLVFVSERIRGVGERDVYLYDRQVGRLVATPGLNSSAEDFDPALSWVP